MGTQFNLPQQSEADSQLLKEFLEMGFAQKHIRRALKMTKDKEYIAELALKFAEEADDGDWEDEQSSGEQAKESNFEPYKMIFLVNASLKMDKATICNQVADACLNAFLDISETAKFDEISEKRLRTWENQACAKIVVKTDKEEDLIRVAEQARKRGINCYAVSPPSKPGEAVKAPSVLGLGPIESSSIDPLTKQFGLL